MISESAPSQTNDPGYRIVKLDSLKSDTVDLSNGEATRGVCCGTAGAATFTDILGNKCTDFPLQQGYNPIRIKRLWSTNLAASNIWGLF